MAVTWYGGSVTSYAEVNGLAVNGVNSNVYTDEALTNRLTDLRDKDGTVTDHVTTASNGHYKFGINGYSGVVYLNFGNGTFADQPRDVGNRLVAAETALVAATAAITALQAAPSALSFTDAGTWAATTAYSAGAFRTEPDGSRRIVTTGYTSGGTYGSADTANSKLVAPAPPTGFQTQSAADVRYAPLGAAFKQVALWAGNLVYTGYDMDVNGTDFIAAGAIHQLDVEMELPPIGADAIFDFYRLVPSSNAETLIGTVTVTAGTVHGQFTYTGSSGATPDVAVADGDKATVRLRQVGTTFAGRGAKVRLSLAGRTFAAVTAPGVPSALHLISATATSVTLGWTQGTNSSQALIYVDGIPYQNMGSTTTFTHAGLDPVKDAAGHVYSVQARRYSALSAIASGTVTAAPNTTVDWLPNAGGDGVVDATMIAIIKGTGVSGSGAVVTGGRLITTSSNTTAGGAADRVMERHERDTTTHTGDGFAVLFRPLNSGWQREFYFKSGLLDPLGASTTNYFVLQADVSGVKFAGKLGTVNPSAVGGSGAVGSFQLFSDTAYPTNLFTTGSRVAGGKMPWPSGSVPLSTSTDVGLYVECLPVSPTDGSQTINVRYGTSTQFGAAGATASSMPLWFSVTIPANMLTGMVGGRILTQIMGSAAAGGTVNSDSIADFIPFALTPSGN